MEALIFDMDGTLVDSERLHYECWLDILGHCGVAPFTFRDYTRYVGASNEALARDFIVSDKLAATVEELVSAKQERYLERIPSLELLPGVMAVLERFKQTYRLAIASSSQVIELQRILDNFRLADLFELVVGGDMVKEKKPNPEIYLKTCSLLGLTPGQCFAFEDSEVGVQAARRAGLLTIAVPNTLSAAHDFSQADLVVSRIDLVDSRLLAELQKVRSAALFTRCCAPLSVPR